MKVRIAAHGRFHSFDLAVGLFRQGHLETLQTTYPKGFVRQSVNAPLPVESHTMIEVFRRAAQAVRLGPQADPLVLKWFAQKMANDIGNCAADILVGWSSATLECITPAQARGIKVVIERGSSHIRHQSRLLEDNAARAGVQVHRISQEIIERELEEYEHADAICVPSDYAARTFTQQGVAPGKIIVNRLGVDLGRFRAVKAIDRPPRQRLNLLFVGEIDIRKGIHILLEAVTQSSDDFDLALVGKVTPNAERLVRKYSDPRIRLLGPVAKADMPRVYQSADIFVLPSIEEGFGMAATEAMASGLPVILSDAVGASEVIENDRSGLVFNTGDANALAQALHKLVESNELRASLGLAGRRVVENMEGWDAYIDRAITSYHTLLGKNAE